LILGHHNCYFELTCNSVATGLQADAGKFFLFMLAIFAQNMAASGIIYWLGASVGVFSVAQTGVSMFLAFSMVLLSTCNVLILSCLKYWKIFYCIIRKCT